MNARRLTLDACCLLSCADVVDAYGIVGFMSVHLDAGCWMLVAGSFLVSLRGESVPVPVRCAVCGVTVGVRVARGAWVVRVRDAATATGASDVESQASRIER